MRYRVLPYRQGSAGAKALATALGGRVLKLVNSQFNPTADDVIVNWGNTFSNGENTVLAAYCLNHPAKIKNASNKLNFFTLMGSDNSDIIPRWWTNKETIPDDAFPIVCRTVLAGHSGDGIVIASDRSGLVPAPLYVQYVKKKDEYRIHVGKASAVYDGGPCQINCSGGCVDCAPDEHFKLISVQRKAKRNGAENVNWQVRNHANGFVYVRQDVNPPQAVIEAAKKALEATGLDFGAVDVIWNAQQEKAYVLEINTAPGLEGQTVTDYASFFGGSPSP